MYIQRPNPPPFSHPRAEFFQRRADTVYFRIENDMRYIDQFVLRTKSFRISDLLYLLGMTRSVMSGLETLRLFPKHWQEASVCFDILTEDGKTMSVFDLINKVSKDIYEEVTKYLGQLPSPPEVTPTYRSVDDADQYWQALNAIV